MSSLWQRLLRLPNGHDELAPLKDEFSRSARRVQESARNLARAAERVTQQKRHDDLERLLHRFRLNEGHD